MFHKATSSLTVLYKKTQDDAEETKAIVEVFDEPWREINWNKQEIAEELKNFQLSSPVIMHLRFLMIGPVGAGKSSFVNSTNSAFQNRITNKAVMATSSESYCTNIFDPNNSMSSVDVGYISKPSLDQKSHCLVCVVSGKTISKMDYRTTDKIKQTFKEATMYGISQVIIMTHIDEVCPLVKKDLRQVYMSGKIKEKMQECSKILSVPMTCIFPVKNYYEETKTNDDIDVLLLSAIKHIVHFANDFTEAL